MRKGEGFFQESPSFLVEITTKKRTIMDSFFLDGFEIV